MSGIAVPYSCYNFVASQQLLAMSAADATANLLRLCAYLSGLQTNRKASSLPHDQGSLWRMTAHQPFEAYDQTVCKIFRILAFSCLLLRSRRAPSGKQQDGWGLYEHSAQI